MMTTTHIKERLHEYIDTAPEEKLKAFYTIIEDTIETNDVWADEEFVAEMERREQEFLIGNSKGVSIDEAVANATKAVRG